MTRKNTLIIAFVCLAVAQLAVPFSMIGQREITLQNGRAFKFRTAPVDPYDAFRGRYVALSLEQARSVSVTNAADFEHGQRVFALIETNDQGFARIARVSPDRPAVGDYVKTRVGYSWNGNLNLDLPFDRYYMNETRAPQAERAYRRFSSGTNRNSYVTVRISSGFAVIEELYVDDTPITRWVKEHPQPR